MSKNLESLTFRKLHDLNIIQFCKILKIPYCSYYDDLLGQSGSKMFPASSLDSPGGIILNSLKKINDPNFVLIIPEMEQIKKDMYKIIEFSKKLD